MSNLIKYYSEIDANDIQVVGGKNASLGEMYSALRSTGIIVPEGFAITTKAYLNFIHENELNQVLADTLSQLNLNTFDNLAQVGAKARKLILDASLPVQLVSEINETIDKINKDGWSYAVRSSATAEDLPEASFAGQHDSFLNISPGQNMMSACKACYASLFTDRAIKYRIDQGVDHMKVALSIGVQRMIRSDLACSGVSFTMDPDSGFENVVLISGSWGLGDNIVQGEVNTDEFLVFKKLLNTSKQPVISHKMGSKLKTLVYASQHNNDLLSPEDSLLNTDTPPEKAEQYILTDGEVNQLAKWSCAIQNHYGCHMDIEWAKDGQDGDIYIVQARPETVHSQSSTTFIKQYSLEEKGKVLCTGAGLGNKIVTGVARYLKSHKEIGKLQEGEILVTNRTGPDWEPILKKASAIITDQGGRTSHAAIVARELGAIAVLGTGDATKAIQDGQVVTVSTARGNTGYIYEGALEWTEKIIDIKDVQETKTQVMLILANPDGAFNASFLPNDGVGLMRMEFIITSAIGIHPMALKQFEKVNNLEIQNEIIGKTRNYSIKEEYFIQTLAEATAKIAAAFYPKDVIVRMSDLKSSEYKNLLGGEQFEPSEMNPMIGLRGASRYYHPMYKEAFEMECKAMRIVRDNMGLKNVKLMIPFCRTVNEAKKVIDLMENYGLKRGENGLEIYVMVEIPSNAIGASEFAKYFDGFSIGSNDLTQLTLGVDRDSELLSEVFDPFEPSVMNLIKTTLKSAQKAGVKTGLCGQAPSDFPEYAQFLVENGIDSISFNQDALIQGIENIALAEKQLITKTNNHERSI
jgi:pyruvate,water dikinase